MAKALIMKVKCRYKNCARLVRVTKESGECSPCVARHKYWNDKDVDHRLKRRRQLALSGETMAEFISDTRLKKEVVKLYKKEVREDGKK